MSSVVLRIEPDPGPWPGGEYANCWPIGGEITGRVHIQSADGQRARRTYLELEWLTRGRGDRNQGAVATAELLAGDVPPGTDLQCSFRFVIPEEGPISYHGQLVQVAWMLRACVDIPWGRDIEQRLEITVLPA